MAKLTKQGVRDLSHLPEGPSRGRKIETPSTIAEKQRMCSHPVDQRERSYYGYSETCLRCGARWEGDYL